MFRAFWGSSPTFHQQFGVDQLGGSYGRKKPKKINLKKPQPSNSHTKPRRSQRLGCFHLVAGWTNSNPLWNILYSSNWGSSSPINGVNNSQRNMKKSCHHPEWQSQKILSGFSSKMIWNLHPTCECWDVFPPKKVANWMFPKIVGFPTKSSILIGISLINHPFWATPIFGFPPNGTSQIARPRSGRLEGRMSIKEPNWNDARRLTFAAMFFCFPSFFGA